jgi:hypothetical protein
MRHETLSGRADDQLIEQFRRMAIETGEATVNWLPAARKKRCLLDIVDVLRGRGKEPLLKLSRLLRDKNRFVRYYTATELLDIFPQQCLPVIEENTKEPDALAGDARFCLRMFKERTGEGRH